MIYRETDGNFYLYGGYADDERRSDLWSIPLKSLVEEVAAGYMEATWTKRIITSALSIVIEPRFIFNGIHTLALHLVDYR